MKLISIINKSLKEQLRSIWVLLLSLSMGPFFIFVYYLIMESSKIEYDVLFINNDKGVMIEGQQVSHGRYLIDAFTEIADDTSAIPVHCRIFQNRNEGIYLLKDKKADAMIVIPDDFSSVLQSSAYGDSTAATKVEFIGDITSVGYILSAVFAGEVLNDYSSMATGVYRAVTVQETPLGMSGAADDFDMMVPGLLVVSLIMLMFTASIAFVSEVENKTILRLKLSKLRTLEFLGGVGFVQLLLGVASVLVTLLTALALGFNYAGSLTAMILLACLTSLSIIAFSLIIAGITKSANEVLVVGNFPMFLFMFFTGAAFPLKSEALFTIAGYPVTWQGLLTPSHAISALQKTLIMDMDLASVVPEIIAIVLLSVLYFMIGALIFNRRHLRLA